MLLLSTVHSQIISQDVPTKDKVVSKYNGFSGAKMHTWGPGNDGVEVKLLELADKGHWICKETQVYTGKEIWNFCKNYSLNKTTPNVSITVPKTGQEVDIHDQGSKA